MTENQTPEDADLTPEEMADEETTAIDALTGEVVTVTADDDDDIPEGISPELTQARLQLVEAASVGLAIGLDLLGVSAPDQM